MAFAPAHPHGAIRAVFPDVYFVTGTVQIGGPLPARFSRNMTIIREGPRLVLINSMRLGPEGLAALDALGKVTDVIRLAGFHGMDDPFYKDRYGARVWSVRGQRYTSGFDARSAKTYFSPESEMDATTALPLEKASLYIFSSAPPEALLVLDRDGGIVVSGDCLQNWVQPDVYFNGPARFFMRAMGFIKPYNLGPGWVKQAKPPKAELLGILDLRFEHVLPAHGVEVIGGAREKYRPTIEKVAR